MAQSAASLMVGVQKVDSDHVNVTGTNTTKTSTTQTLNALTPLVAIRPQLCYSLGNHSTNCSVRPAPPNESALLIKREPKAGGQIAQKSCLAGVNSGVSCAAHNTS